jgi:D-alanyl-lipoteichoic acid acyltransferase DltB (MBOAT superfamily)
MLFCTYAYFAFFSAVLVVFYASPRRWRNTILLAASYFFYISWNWRFVPLLAGLTVIDYAAAIWIERTGGHRRRLALLASLAANLGFLGFFKYYNFTVSTLAALAGFPEDRWRLAIVLPLGISFHTFQSISYVVDVYRGEQAAVRRFRDYALFISFFPQLVAGPIVRAHQFFRDLASWTPPSREEVQHGAFLIVLGVAKKLVLADNFAAIADRYFQGDATVGAWTGVLAFSFQIYFDFSGYTDIAIGSALLLGFHFPVNFRRPYLAVSITDFWRRWHISLSSWLRDYIYVPLGGNRRGAWQTYRNLFLTMLLGGLWHGANWTFVVWGGYHGVLLAIERSLGISRTTETGWSLRYAPRCVLTFLIASVGWVFFRAGTLHQAIAILGALFQWPLALTSVEPALLVLITAALVLAVLEEMRKALDRLRFAPLWATGAIAGVLLFVIELFTTGNQIPFIYFQF